MSNEDSRFSPVPNAQSPRHTDKDNTAATGKLLIGSLDQSDLVVEAMFNPKELEITRNVPWSKTNEANKSNRRGTGSGKGDDQGIHLEFTGAEGRSLSLELLFDGYEFGKGRAVDVAKCVKALEDMATVREAGSKKNEDKRPHRCIIVWGTALPKFKCVIESLSTKYTMFDSDGKPLRATCVVKVKEADIVTVAKKK